MNLRFLLVLIPIVTFFYGCKSIPDSYSDQLPLVVKHDIEKDAAATKNKKIVLLIPAQSVKYIKSDQLYKQLEEAFLSDNKWKVVIIRQSQHEKIAAINGALSELKRIKNKYMSGITDDEVRKYAKKIKADIVLVPMITFHEYKDISVPVVYAPAERIDEYYWLTFRVIEMQLRARVDISMRMIYITSENPSETLHVSHEIEENYDTNLTYTEKLKSIKEENVRREIENLRRIRREEEKRIERERERQRAEKKAKSKSDKAFVILGTVLDAVGDSMGDGWCMLKPLSTNVQFKKGLYLDKALLVKHLIKQGGSNLYRDYITRFDGTTLKGDCANGYGDFMFINGDIFKGQWLNAEATGFSEYHYSNGSVFSGNFINGLAEGDGTFIKFNGNIFKGKYKKGKKEGVGQFFVNDPENILYDSLGYVRMKNNMLNEPLLKPAKGVNYKVHCSDGGYESILGIVK